MYLKNLKDAITEEIFGGPLSSSDESDAEEEPSCDKLERGDNPGDNTRGCDPEQLIVPGDSTVLSTINLKDIRCSFSIEEDDTGERANNKWIGYIYNDE